MHANVQHQLYATKLATLPAEPLWHVPHPVMCVRRTTCLTALSTARGVSANGAVPMLTVADKKRSSLFPFASPASLTLLAVPLSHVPDSIGCVW